MKATRPLKNMTPEELQAFLKKERERPSLFFPNEPHVVIASDIEVRCYRIIEVGDDGKPRTLFHGVRGSRIIDLDTWIDADHKMVRDGGGKNSNYYLSGFNVLKNIADAKKYLSRFKKRREKLKIVPVRCRGPVREKPTNPDVWLVSGMKLTSSDYKDRDLYTEL